jgi:hypothetical protein
MEDQRYIKDQNPATITTALPTSYGTLALSPTWGPEHHKRGWRKLDPREDYTPPEGKQITEYLYEQDAFRDDYAVEIPITAPIPVVEPYPTPESLCPILDADGEQVGTGRIIMDAATGEVVGVVHAQSPAKSDAEQRQAFREQAQRLRIERRSLREAARRAVATDVDAMTPEDAEALAGIFEPWAAGEAVTIGMIRESGGMLWKCLQAHTTQSDWQPQDVPALWLRVAAPEEILDWVQPAGAHDAYNIGDKVRFNGKVYESLINANVWSPTGYPQGWKVVS